MSEAQTTVNDHLVLIGGKSTAGKSASLMGIENPEGVWYLNCESGKKLPFKSKFREFTITDPLQVYQAFEKAETKPEVHTIVVDTLTYLMDMYESLYVVGSANTMQAWGQYAQYFKNLMQQYVAKSTKNVIFLAHTANSLNETEMSQEVAVPIKGSVKNNGVESYFSVVISAKRLPLKALAAYKNDMLTITPTDERLGYKHVFQTQPTKETFSERLRGPMGLFSEQETFIDNNTQHLINRLRDYYA